MKFFKTQSRWNILWELYEHPISKNDEIVYNLLQLHIKFKEMLLGL